MELSHRFTVPTGVEETWAHFQDIASVAECFPGAQVTSADERRFAGSVKVKLGPIALVYNGSGTFVEKDETAHRFVVDAKGKDKRGNGTAGAHVTVTMTDAAGSTDVSVDTDLAITGKPAQFGRGVMQDVSDKLLGQFVACLEKRLQGGGDEPAAEEAAVPEPTPVAAAAAADGHGHRTEAHRRAAPAGREATSGRAGGSRLGRGGAPHPREGLLEAGPRRRARAARPAAPALPLTRGSPGSTPRHACHLTLVAQGGSGRAAGGADRSTPGCRPAGRQPRADACRRSRSPGATPAPRLAVMRAVQVITPTGPADLEIRDVPEPCPAPTTCWWRCTASGRPSPTCC